MNHLAFYHQHTRRLAILALTVLAVFTASCSLLSEDDDGPTTLGTNVQFGKGPIDFVYRADTGAFTVNTELGIYTITRQETYCGSEGLIEIDTFSERRSYEIRGSELVTRYDESSCYANVYSGGDVTTLQGNWVMTGSEKNPNASSYCDEEYDDVESIETERTLSIQNGIAIETSSFKNFCWAEMMADNSYEDEEEPSTPQPTVTKIDCGTISLSDGTNTAQLQLISIINEQLTAKVTYKGKSCTVVQPDQSWTAQSCAVAYQAWLADPDANSYFEAWDYEEGGDLEDEPCIQGLGIPDVILQSL